MDLKCKGVGCYNMYKVDVSGVGGGFVGLVAVAWKCNACGRWNLYVKDVIDGVEVTI